MDQFELQIKINALAKELDIAESGGNMEEVNRLDKEIAALMDSADMSEADRQQYDRDRHSEDY